MSHLPFLLFIPENAAPSYVEFWKLWQDGEWFAAHEGLEGLWRETSGQQKQFFNGLIHAAVALYQHERGNALGACRQSVRMQEKLVPFAPQFYGVQVVDLMRAIEKEIAPSKAHLDQTQAAQVEKLRMEVREKLNRN